MTNDPSNPRPATWSDTLDNAVARLREWAAGNGKPTPGRFDARDREALAFVLERLRELETKVAELEDFVRIEEDWK